MLPVAAGPVGMSELAKPGKQRNVNISGTKYTVPSHYFEGCKEVSWQTLGDAMKKKLVEEVACVSKVDFRYGLHSSVKIEAEKLKNPWEFIHEKHDVMVFRKKGKDSRLSFIGRGVIDRPLREVAEYVKDMQNNMSWDNFIIEVRHIKTVSETPTSIAFVGYNRYETKKCMLMTKRDMLYLANCSYQGDRYIHAGMSIDNPDHPCPPGMKRIEAAMGSGWIMDKLNGSEERTLVTYVGDVDLKGIPNFVMNVVLKRHPLAVYHLRRQMIDPALPRSRCASDASTISAWDEEFDDTCLLQSMELPDDFVPLPTRRDSDSSNEYCHTSFEESMPLDHFTKLH